MRVIDVARKRMTDEESREAKRKILTQPSFKISEEIQEMDVITWRYNVRKGWVNLMDAPREYRLEKEVHHIKHGKSGRYTMELRYKEGEAIPQSMRNSGIEANERNVKLSRPRV